MKKLIIIAIALVMAVSFGTGSAFAANSLKQGTLGLNFDTDGDDMLFGKFFVMNDLAILAGFGLGVKGGDAEGTDLSLAGGIRKYLKTDDFAPFVGGFFQYENFNDGDNTNIAVLAEFGAEYFLGKQFSIEGSVGFGYTSEEETFIDTSGFFPAAVTVKTNNVGTARSGFSINLYF